jgi:hypothetical protein
VQQPNQPPDGDWALIATERAFDEWLAHQERWHARGAQEPSGEATEDAGAPVLAPGLYRLHGPRLWRHDELTVIWVAGLGWAVVPRVALAALPTGEGSDARA